MIILAPFIFVSWLTIIIPYRITRWLITHKIKDIIFDNTVTIYGTFVFYFILLIVTTIVGLTQFGLIGLSLPVSIVLMSLLGIELIDEYVNARFNWRCFGQKVKFQRLYDEVSALVKRR